MLALELVSIWIDQFPYLLDIQWAWQICDSQLSAMVELIPTGTLEIDGMAEVDLLIIEAGVELSGSFNAALIPQGSILQFNTITICLITLQPSKDLNVP
jgi:hypothetical protein